MVLAMMSRPHLSPPNGSVARRSSATGATLAPAWSDRMSFMTSASGSTTLPSSAPAAPASGFLPPFSSPITSARGSTTVELNALPGVGPVIAGSAAPGGNGAGVGESPAPSVIHDGGA